MKYAVFLMIAACALAQDGKKILIKNAKVFNGADWTACADVLVEDGAISKIDKNIDEAGAKKIEGKNLYVAPAFIDAYAQFPEPYELKENAEPITFDLTGFDGFSTDRAKFERAISSGVTIVGVAPGDAAIIPGQVSFMSLTRDRIDRMVVDKSAALKLSLKITAFEYSKSPTSRAGLFNSFETFITDEVRTFLKVKPLLVCVSDSADVEFALGLARDYRVILYGGQVLSDYADRIAKAGAAVVLEPVRPDSPEKLRALPALLAKRNATFAFSSSYPESGHDFLRMQAAFAVRSGLKPADALKALTSSPAKIFGLEGYGSVRQGAKAEILIFSDDPSNPASQILDVISDGKIVYSLR